MKSAMNFGLFSRKNVLRYVTFVWKSVLNLGLFGQKSVSKYCLFGRKSVFLHSNKCVVRC